MCTSKGPGLAAISRDPFGSLNHGQCDAINREPACPKLPANRTYRRRGANDANEPLAEVATFRLCACPGKTFRRGQTFASTAAAVMSVENRRYFTFSQTRVTKLILPSLVNGAGGPAATLRSEIGTGEAS